MHSCVENTSEQNVSAIMSSAEMLDENKSSTRSLFRIHVHEVKMHIVARSNVASVVNLVHKTLGIASIVDVKVPGL